MGRIDTVNDIEIEVIQLQSSLETYKERINLRRGHHGGTLNWKECGNIVEVI